MMYRVSVLNPHIKTLQNVVIDFISEMRCVDMINSQQFIGSVL